jgi:hypothetical protein
MFPILVNVVVGFITRRKIIMKLNYMTTLKSLTTKIKKVIPEIENYYNSGTTKFLGEDFKNIEDAFDRDITLEDILICLKGNKRLGNYDLIKGYFNFHYNEADEQTVLFPFKLNTPLHLQSPDTIKYLDEIIK